MNPLYLGLALTALVLVGLVLWFLRRFGILGGGGGGGGSGKLPAPGPHIAGFLETDKPWISSHNHIAKHNAGREQAILDSAVANGWTAMYIMAALDKDYGGRAVRYSHDQRDHWRKWLTEIRKKGIRVVLWIRSDDSPDINRWSERQFEDFTKLVHADLGDLVTEYVTALEVDEYWDQGRANRANAMVKRVTGKRVGCHITPRLDRLGWCKGADIAYIQPGFDRDPAAVAAYCREAANQWSGPIVCAEYDLKSGSAAARAKGDAAARAHSRIIGLGTGAGDDGRRLIAGRT